MTRHYYLQQDWGHAIAGFARTGDEHNGTPVFGGCVFGRHIREGDEILLNQVSGRTAVYVVLTTRRPLDPGDQYFITAYPDHYLDEETPTVEDHPPAGTRMRNPHTGSVFVRVEGGYHAEQLGTEPVHGKQGSYLYRDGEGRTGPLEPLTTTTEGTE